MSAEKLSLTNKRWVYATSNNLSSEENPSCEGIGPVVKEILLKRDIGTTEKLSHFIHPSGQNFSPLDNIPNIGPAAAAILKAIQDNQSITVYGDYDVDGVTGTTLLVSAIQELGAKKIDYYIPHRFTEGYGLNKAAIQKLKDTGTQILITVDCGISNYEEIKLAKSLGLTVIVTDHHMPPVVMPPADFLVNPKLNNNDFASRELSGVGVAFKLIEKAFQLAGNKPYSKSLKYLDLVALGTVADVVPLLEENRILTVLGLKQLNHKTRPGIRALCDVADLEQGQITVKDIGFGIGPRINAAGRMDRASTAVKLLLSETIAQARPLAEKLNELNIERQETGLEIKEKVAAEIEAVFGKTPAKMLILSAEGWHPGIIGIVASQIVKKYHRPTALISVENGKGRGSIRSLDNLDIFEPLSKCGYLLEDFGGHKAAAGFEIKAEKIEEFKKHFSKIIEATISDQDLIPSLKIDMKLKKEQINFALAQELEQLEPYGQSNPVPVFSTDELSVYDFRKIGGGKHLKLSLTDGEQIIEGVAFGAGDMYDKLRNISKLEIAFSLSINEWQGRKSLQLLVRDCRDIS